MILNNDDNVMQELIALPETDLKDCKNDTDENFLRNEQYFIQNTDDNSVNDRPMSVSKSASEFLDIENVHNQNTTPKRGPGRPKY